MGTRNLTMVVMNGKFKVAQYGQWDGYPEGQGFTVLRFLKSNSLDGFKKRLKQVKFMGKKENAEMGEFLKSIGCKDGWMNKTQSQKYHEKYPLLTRDNGANILQMIMDSLENPIYLTNSVSFAGDSLFCEWAYLIDLDKNVLEVYTGFNQEPLTENDRFYKYTSKKEKYTPIKLAKSYPLDNLPTEDDFVNDFREEEIEEETEQL